MWFHRKDKTPPTPPVPAPRGHRRITVPAPAVDVARWLLAEADQLDTEATAKENQAEVLLSHAIEWRAVAAAKRALAVSIPAAPQPGAFPAPAPAVYDDPQPEDLSRFNLTYQVPCACRHWLGESCAQCDDALVPPGALWTPPSGESRDGLTVLFPAVNGEAR